MTKPTVLVVDDDDLLRELTAQVVEDADCTAIIASNADEALALLEDHLDIALIITDIQMPGSMNGLVMANVVRRRWPDVALIIISGNVSPTQHELPEGAIFMRKPYSMQKLQNDLVRYTKHK